VSFKAYNYRIEGDLNYRHYLNTTYTHFPHAICNYGQERLSSFLANPWLNTSLAVCLKMCPKNSTTLFGILHRHMAQSSNIFFFFVWLNDSAAIQWTLGVYHRCPRIALENDIIKNEQGVEDAK